MKIFLCTVRCNELPKEPWGDTIKAVVREKTKEDALTLLLTGIYQNRIPEQFWDVIEIPTDGDADIIMTSEYGNI